MTAFQVALAFMLIASLFTDEFLCLLERWLGE